MKNSFFKISVRFLSLFAMVYALVLFVAPELLGKGLTEGALAMAVGTPSGEIDTGSTARERVKPDISSEITIVRPDMFRLDEALRRIPTKKATDIDVKWEEVGQRPRIATISSASNISTGSSVQITFANAGEYAYFLINDTCRVMDPLTSLDHTGFAGVNIIVTAVDSVNNRITVKAFKNTGFLNVPAINANTHGSALSVVRIGHAKTEKEGVGDPTAMNPVTKVNYVHTFEKFISQSKMRGKLSTYTKDDVLRNIEQGIFDMRLDMEGTFWDGVGGKTTKDNDQFYTMKGFTSFATTNVIALPDVGSLTEKWLLGVGEQMSSSVHGSEEKMLYVSPSLWTELSELNLVNGTLQNKRQERVLGSFATRINTGHVEFLIANHKGFPLLGKKRYGAIVDMANIKKRVLEPLEKVSIDPEKSGGARTKGVKYIETCSLEVRNEETHGQLI